MLLNYRFLVPSVVLTALFLASCAQSPRDKGDGELLAPIPSYGAAPLIRVKLSKPSGQDEVKVNAGESTISLDGSRFDADGEITFTRTGDRVVAEGYGDASSIELTPKTRPEHLDVEGRLYRGKLRIIAGTSGWDVVNVVDLEQYVAGVIGWEMISSWPVEALKAQAVASRTYALFEMERARANGQNWDLDDTAMYQVYGGVGPSDKPNHWRESSNVLQARELTTGQVLTYHGKGFRAYFHSTSGGRTTDPISAFGLDETIEPLAGADLGEYGKESPKHHWEIKIEHNELKARLIEKGIKPNDIIRVDNAETADSGHAITLKLYDRTGHHTRVSAIAFRQALGLYSTRFTAEKNGTEWTFKGSGYGHGCGMCQWSARGMAADGWRAERILRTMYPGSELKTVY
jgi:stage II sporulation protein D